MTAFCYGPHHDGVTMNHEERKQYAQSSPGRNGKVTLELEEEDVFSRWLSILNDFGVSYLVGGPSLSTSIRAYGGLPMISTYSQTVST
jgi:hypothetical protein